jgi:DNA repair ATPase RecN
MIQASTEATHTADSSTIRSHRICSINIVGGFLDGLTIELANGLNCLIGHRGTGKTTMLEFIRYALDVFPDGANDGACRKRVESLVKSNLGDGRIRLTIETKDGLEYIVDRTASGEPMVLTSDGQPTNIALNSGGIFNADIFSQNEVENIADSPESQLALIDTFAVDEINSTQAEISGVQAELDANAKAIIPAQEKLARLADDLNMLGSVEAKIEALSNVGGQDAEAINQAQVRKAMRGREKKTIGDAGDLVEKYVNWMSDGVGQFTADAEGLFDEDTLAGPNAEILQRAFNRLGAVGGDMDRLLRTCESLLAGEQEMLASDAAELQSAHDRQELEFRNLITKHQEAQGQATQRAEWESVRNDLLAKQRQRTDLTDRLDSLKAQRRELIDRLADLRDRRFALRMQMAERITDEVASPIRMRVEQDGNRQRYYSMLAEALKSAALHHKTVARKISEVMAPGELVEAIRRNDTDELQRHVGLNSQQAAKVITALGDLEVLLRIETVELVDLPKIELQDGEEWKDSLSLSTGQKCTAILPILLLDSDNPLLVDQPEDNLDNRFIYDTVVKSLRQVKCSRQVVLITHNPNIPVLGDAGGVFVLTSDGSQSRLLNSGGVDTCKAEIINLLEGGEEAFVQRKERYNY